MVQVRPALRGTGTHLAHAGFCAGATCHALLHLRAHSARLAPACNHLRAPLLLLRQLLAAAAGRKSRLLVATTVWSSGTSCTTV
jgi:hypothetical protein